MRIMLNDEFENLYKQYQNAVSVEDKKIRLKLNEIISCYSECGIGEHPFADEITKKFCELVKILKEQNNANAEYKVPQNANGFIASKQREIEYGCDQELLNAFYEYYIQQMSAATIKDYVARVNTFVNKYMLSVPGVVQLLKREEVRRDEILFLYKYLDLIIANFNTCDENGNPVKQKINIRSALKKLNEFKHIQEAQNYIR